MEEQQPRYPNKRGRPANGQKGATKHCCHSTCKNDTRYPDRCPGVTFFPFPKPCLDFRKGVPGHAIEQCHQCSKSRKWQVLCNRTDDRFRDLKQVKTSTYICSAHFVSKDGPSAEFPDPISIIGKRDMKITLEKTKSSPPPQVSLLRVKTTDGPQTSTSKLYEILTSQDDLNTVPDVQQHEACHRNEVEQLIVVVPSEIPFQINERNSAASKPGENVVATCNDNTSETFKTAIALLDKTDFSVSYDNENDVLQIHQTNHQGFVEKQIRLKQNAEADVSILNFPLDKGHDLVKNLSAIKVIPSNVNRIVECLNRWKICKGISREELLNVFMVTKSLLGALHINGTLYSKCCSRAIGNYGSLEICPPCKKFERVLQLYHNRHRNREEFPKKNTNLRFFTHKQLVEYANLITKKLRVEQKKCKRQRMRLERKPQDNSKTKAKEVKEHSVVSAYGGNPLRNECHIASYVLELKELN